MLGVMRRGRRIPGSALVEHFFFLLRRCRATNSESGPVLLLSSGEVLGAGCSLMLVAVAFPRRKQVES